MATPAGSASRVGPLLREWRARCGISQLELALDVGVSARHLSFVETGRARPSAQLVQRLADRLEVPAAERNQLLVAAGHAPVLPALDLAPVREAIELILRSHEPNPAVVVDRHWNVVAANAAMGAVAAFVDPALLEPPLNAMRVGLHPRGLAARIVNLAEVRAYFVGRLRRQVAMTGDDQLAALLAEVEAYPGPDGAAPDTPAGHIVTPVLRLRGPGGEELALYATVATFGTAAEVPTSELSIELAFPADERTAAFLRALPQT